MKRLIYPIAAMLLMAICYTSCEKYETYGDKKAKERSAIQRYIDDHHINVINEATFNEAGQTTDTLANEYVLLSRSGVYMQIVREGCGSMLEEKKTVNLLCRFTEYNILADSVLASNSVPFYFYNTSQGRYINGANFVDKMSVKRSGTTITASFVEGVMMMVHSSSSSVPSGWLVPLNYINVGRPTTSDDEIAKVRLIVPHSQGTAEALATVYPCYYEITYERER